MLATNQDIFSAIAQALDELFGLPPGQAFTQTKGKPSAHQRTLQATDHGHRPRQRQPLPTYRPPFTLPSGAPLRIPGVNPYGNLNWSNPDGNPSLNRTIAAADAQFRYEWRPIGGLMAITRQQGETLNPGSEFGWDFFNQGAGSPETGPSVGGILTNQTPENLFPE